MTSKKIKRFGLRLSEIEQDGLTCLAEIEGLSEAATLRQLLRYAIREIIQLKGAQTRSKKRVGQLKKKRKCTVEQQTKKSMKRRSNAIFYFVNIVISAFTRVVMETVISKFF